MAFLAVLVIKVFVGYIYISGGGPFDLPPAIISYIRNEKQGYQELLNSAGNKEMKSMLFLHL